MPPNSSGTGRRVHRKLFKSIPVAIIKSLMKKAILWHMGFNLSVVGWMSLKVLFYELKDRYEKVIYSKEQD